MLVKKWKNKFLQAGIKPRIFLQIIVGCKTLQHLSQHFGSFLFVSECKHARRKKAEISIALVIYNKMIEFWQQTLKCNKRADSNAIIGHGKLGKSKKLLRFTQAYLHKFMYLVKTYLMVFIEKRLLLRAYYSETVINYQNKFYEITLSHIFSIRTLIRVANWA